MLCFKIEQLLLVLCRLQNVCGVKIRVNIKISLFENGTFVTNMYSRLTLKKPKYDSLLFHVKFITTLSTTIREQPVFQFLKTIIIFKTIIVFLTIAIRNINTHHFADIVST